MNGGKQAVLDLLWNEPYKIGHWVGFKDLTTLHNEWLRSFLYADEDQTLLAHRGSYKTILIWNTVGWRKKLPHIILCMGKIKLLNTEI